MSKNSKKHAKKRLKKANAQEPTVVLRQVVEPSPAPPMRWLVWLRRWAIRPLLMLLARRMQQAGSALASALMPWASSLAPLHGGSVALPSPTGALHGGCDGSRTVPLHGEDGGSVALSSQTAPLHGEDDGSVSLSSPAPTHLRAEPSAVQEGSSAELPGDAPQEGASQDWLQDEKDARQEAQDGAVAPEVAGSPAELGIAESMLNEDGVDIPEAKNVILQQLEGSGDAPTHLQAEHSAVQEGSSAELPGDAPQEGASQDWLQDEKEAGQEAQDAAVAPEVAGSPTELGIAESILNEDGVDIPEAKNVILQQVVLGDINEEYEDKKEEKKGDEKENGENESEDKVLCNQRSKFAS
ncbi:hypothetical protein BRADI_3g11507v3 [Brachypodium distachyon]|uniref:Uncharacterized protein n=1 Tax=Brachypodium distachyon TaxID=15368 RepID=A0A2K2CWN4_BRADI|nr:hypothetical protein BRADI_3g11507v3 [Brachypodium distachyon]